MTIASLIVDVAANTAKLQTDVNKIQGSLDSVGSMASKVGTLMAGAFTVTAITSAATRILDYAGKVNDLAAQTGLSTKAIQEMEHAAKMTGASLEAFTNAAFKLGTNIAGGSNSVQGAIEKLGLSYSQLRAMSPEQQFNTIAAALSTVQNAQERNKLAVELFGKSAQQILPAIAEGYDNLAKSAHVAGDAQLKALDMAGDALDDFTEGVMSLGVQLAGGFVIAVRETISLFDDWIGITKSLKAGFDAWGTALEFVGLKAQELPKVMGQMKVSAGSLPQPLQAVSISVAEQETRMKALEAAHVRVVTSTRSVGRAQEDVDENIQRLTDSFTRQIESFRQQNTLLNTVYPGWQGLQRVTLQLGETLPSVTQQFVPFREAVQQSGAAVSTWGSTVSNTMASLPSVIMGAIQGGGSVVRAAGAQIGTSLMQSFVDRFGPAIQDALPFGIGRAVNALLPMLGSLFGPVAERIGQFFRNIFGGPSADELRGRQAVADFEAQLHSLLTETQKLEAGNESWKMTVIAIRDAYMAAGLSEAQALQAAERLWASSRDGAEASQKVIDEIRRIMEGGAAAAGDFAANLDHATRDRSIHIGFDVEAPPDLGEFNHEMGFATGSAGIRNFGSGTPVVLHGRERVQTEAQMESERASMGTDPELKRMIRDLPRAMKIAFADALVLSGGRA